MSEPEEVREEELDPSTRRLELLARVMLTLTPFILAFVIWLLVA